MFGGGIAPFATAALLAATHTTWSVAGYITVLAVVSITSIPAAAGVGERRCRKDGMTAWDESRLGAVDRLRAAAGQTPTARKALNTSSNLPTVTALFQEQILRLADQLAWFATRQIGSSGTANGVTVE